MPACHLHKSHNNKKKKQTTKSYNALAFRRDCKNPQPNHYLKKNQAIAIQYVKDCSISELSAIDPYLYKWEKKTRSMYLILCSYPKSQETFLYPKY